MAIFDLRGTHGSGKTSIVQALAAMGSSGPVEGRCILQPCHKSCPAREHPLGMLVHLVGFRCAVFAPGGRTGGAESVPTQEELRARIRWAVGMGQHVIFESALVGHTLGPWRTFALNIGVPYMVGHLDTPADVCIERVRARRAGRGRSTDLAERQVAWIRKDHGGVEKACAGLAAAGVRVRALDHTLPPHILARQVAAWFADAELRVSRETVGA